MTYDDDKSRYNSFISGIIDTYRVIRVNSFAPEDHGFTLLLDLPALWMDNIFKIYENKARKLYLKLNMRKCHLFVSQDSDVDGNLVTFFREDEFSDEISKDDIFSSDKYKISLMN